MKISQAEFRSDVFVPGLKNFSRSSRINAETHHAVIADERAPIEMFTGDDAAKLGAAPSALVIVVPSATGSQRIVVPESNIDFMHGFAAVAAPAPAVQGARK